MTKFLYKDQVYYYKTEKESPANYGWVKVYEDKGWFKVKIGQIKGLYGDPSDNIEDLLEEIMKKIDKKEKVLTIRCSPEITELYS